MKEWSGQRNKFNGQYVSLKPREQTKQAYLKQLFQYTQKAKTRAKSVRNLKMAYKYWECWQNRNKPQSVGMLWLGSWQLQSSGGSTSVEPQQAGGRTTWKQRCSYRNDGISGANGTKRHQKRENGGGGGCVIAAPYKNSTKEKEREVGEGEKAGKHI